jgi:uncharacterized protein (TIGR02596 family)
MPTTNTASSKPAASCLEGRHAAFTFIELLVVVAIIVIVGSMLVSGLGVWSGRAVGNGGNLVVEDISYARELAIETNRPAEIWFVRPTGSTSLTAMQVYTIDDNGNAVAAAEVHYLPAGAAIDTGSNLSTLFGTGNQKQWTGSQAQPSISTFGTQYSCWYIRFMPDASTTLSSSQQWYLTVHSQTLGNQLASLPPNYAMVSVEPVTGNVALYRP